MSRLSRRVTIAFLPAFLALGLCAMSATAQVAKQPPAPPAQAGFTFSADEAKALAGCIRTLAANSLADVDFNLPPKFFQPMNMPLIVVLHRPEKSPIQRFSTKPTIASAARDVAAQLNMFLGKIDQPDALKEARMEIVIVASVGPSETKDRANALAGIEPGVQGLICDGELEAGRKNEKKIYFTPLTLLLYEQDFGALNAAYAAQESTEAPLRVTVSPFIGPDFVEAKPAGEMLLLYRGNVLQTAAPGPDQMVSAETMAAMWLLRTQQPDGSFLTGYLPFQGKTLPEYDIPDHLRATIALLLLDQLFQKEPLSKAAENALQWAMSKERLKTEQGSDLVYLTTPEDEVTGSALLLTALSIRSLRDKQPVASNAMRQLGEYLCTLTASNGRLYATLKGARQGQPPFVARGSIYADALIGLTMLQRVAPTERVRAASQRLADLLASNPQDVQILGDSHTLGRVVEALSEHYKLTRQEKYADAALQLAGRLRGNQLSARQVTGLAQPEDYVGGFADPGLVGPSTFATGEALCGLAAAYEVVVLSHKPREGFLAPVRDGARYLLNMQYRPENSFYLPRQELALGGFRRGPADLNLNCGAIAEATRALLNGTTVVAESAGAQQ